MHTELAPLGVQVATINPGPFDTGFNDRMYETVDQWVTPGENFTPEGPLHEMQGMFADPNFQYNPQQMVDVIVEVLPQDTHLFRTVFPREVCEAAVQYQKDIWDLDISSS